MVRYLRYCSLILSFAFFIGGSLFEFYNIMLIGALLMFVHNVLFSCERIQSRVVFLFFNLTTFVFLLGRPFIGMFDGTMWVKFDRAATYFALTSVLISLFLMFLGALLAENRIASHRPAVPRQARSPLCEESAFRIALRNIALTVFYVAAIAVLLMEFDKLFYMLDKSYVEYYTSYETSMPLPVRGFANMMKPALCIFLATMPKKKHTFIPLCLFMLSAVPMLLIGQRNQIVLNAIFVFLYYFIRDIYLDRAVEKKWLGKLEIGFIIALIPLALIGLSLYNYTREGISVEGTSPLYAIADLIQKQGVSFDVLCRGYNALPDLPQTGPKCYTFGGFIDYFAHGVPSQILFGAQSLGSGNNITKALYGNSFAHSMSYVTRGQEYLDGHGWGSSYILETYADFGWIGIILFSLLLGMLLIYLVKWVKGHWMLSTIAFYSLQSIFLMPRAEATGF